MDNTTEPTSAIESGDGQEPALRFPVVGVGASAGGLEAFTEFLRALPPDTGIAIVFISHLSPNYPSQLAGILGRGTSMPVVQVENESAVEPNHLYVIPPNCSMTIEGGHLQLRPRNDVHGIPHPIDAFFCALARDQRRRAIGVILSGLGDDGTLGLEEIKGAGGFCFAQDASAAQESMPSSAIAAGCVDLVLSPAAIAAELVRISGHPYIEQPAPVEVEDSSEEMLARILTLIHQNLGVDFSSYKKNTLYRRITRRMVLLRLDSLSQYLERLKSDDVELEALFQDVLINVTSFFRNADAFDALRDVALPKLLEDRSRHDPLRIWVLGCSTGEEAYSLAIICQEIGLRSGQAVPVQIFATDLNGAGIEKARRGLYPVTIEQHVSSERLRQFFTHEDGGYRVSKQIRDICVFARHNGLIDPPFSRIDLVSCRNMLIYLDQSLQRRLLPTLNYALKPRGILWLGTSEAISTERELFDVEDAKLKIYRKKEIMGRGPLPILAPGNRAAAHYPVIGKPAFRAASPEPLELHREADRLMLARFAPAGVLISSSLEILQFRGDTGPYLAPAPGTASFHLLKMLREGLLVPVRNAVTRAEREERAVRDEAIAVKTERGTRTIDIEVLPIKGKTRHETCFLVLFQPAASEDSAPLQPSTGRDSTHAEEVAETDRLRQELSATKEYLQSVIESQEAANEELQSANEEVQSSNEELQSINEELETSKEEIQSSNEELATLNEELQNRNVELIETNNDMLNLLASVRLPIVMLGPDLRIRRFTPMAEKMLNLIRSDVGRPISDIKLRLSVEDIDEIVAEVIDSVTVRDLDVKDKQGRWYSLRIRPYRTYDNQIEGAVLVFVDIDTLKRARQYAEGIVTAVAEPLVVLDADLRVQKASHLFYQFFNVRAEQIEFTMFHEICGGFFDIPELRRALDNVRYLDERLTDLEVSSDLREGRARTMLLNAQRLTQDDGSTSIILTLKDISQRKMLEESLRMRVEQLAQANSNQNEFLAMLAHELRNPLAALRSGSQVLELAPDDADITSRTHGMMERQIVHMARMIEDLLDVSRITSGRIQLRFEPVDLVKVVQRTAESMTPVLSDRGQRLAVDSPDQPVLVHGDAVRLEQILTNLLNNASKFTPAGGEVVLALQIETAGGDDSTAQAVLSVKDEGVGIEPEMLARVFEPFMQIHPSTGSTGGLGIGLTLVRRLAELHGGTVEATSTGLGKGSCFAVRLPIRFVDEVAAAPAERHEGSATKVRRVLVVDDNVDAAESMALLLRFCGHEVCTAHDGQAAIEAAEEFEPDAVLLDLGLPVRDGYEVAKLLRQHPEHENTILIALTGYGQESDRERTAQAGFDVHMMKPVNLEDVERKLSELADQRRQARR